MVSRDEGRRHVQAALALHLLVRTGPHQLAPTGRGGRNQ